MAQIINDKEIESVIALPAKGRYEYFVKRVADWRVVWSLGNEDGWVLASDDSGAEVVPVWPHQRYAKLCIAGHWQGSLPRSITLDDWLKKWLPGIKKDNRKIAVFQSPASHGVLVDSDRLRDDLEEELCNFLPSSAALN